MQESKQRRVGSETVAPAPVAPAAAGSKPLPSRIQHYLNSGSKKHVFIGLLIISAVTCAPWFMLTSGSKHQNHADYMDQAEKARQSRLSATGTQPSDAR